MGEAKGDPVGLAEGLALGVGDSNPAGEGMLGIKGGVYNGVGAEEGVATGSALLLKPSRKYPPTNTKAKNSNPTASQRTLLDFLGVSTGGGTGGATGTTSGAGCISGLGAWDDMPTGIWLTPPWS